MPIYTKKGDKGETGLFTSNKNGPKRLSKDSLRIEVIGAIDEVNSVLGVAKSFVSDPKIVRIITNLQKDLFITASIIAGSNLSFSSSKVKRLEQAIDEWDKRLPRVSNFIIPGGSQAGALIFYARAMSRRAERRAVSLNKVEKLRPVTLKFLNRVSDYLWMLSRQVNSSEGFGEEIWMGRRT